MIAIWITTGGGYFQLSISSAIVHRPTRGHPRMLNDTPFFEHHAVWLFGETPITRRPDLAAVHDNQRDVGTRLGKYAQPYAQ